MKKIVIAIDFSDKIGRVLNQGLELAEKFGAEVLLLHTDPPRNGYVYSSQIGPYGGLVGFGVNVSLADEITSNKLKNEEHALNALKEKAEDRGLTAVTANIEGEEVSTTIEKCREFGADLLIMGLHKHSFFHNLLEGNTELSLVKNAPCAVMLIPE